MRYFGLHMHNDAYGELGGDVIPLPAGFHPLWKTKTKEKKKQTGGVEETDLGSRSMDCGRNFSTPSSGNACESLKRKVQK